MHVRIFVKFSLLLMILTLWHIRLFAQTASDTAVKPTVKEKISFGFNYHLQISHLDISPIVVFPLNKRVQVGFGLNYLYHYRNSTRVGKSSLGGNIFSRVFVHKNIYTHVEYLYSDVAYLNQLIYEFHRVKKADFFVGAGYRQPISDRTNGFLTLLVNLNHSEESPYKNLILLKAGITF